MEERMIGFAAREMRLGYTEIWQGRRSLFLLREDLIKPLSTDEMVWGSVIDEEKVELPKWRGYYAGFWEDLGELEKCLDKYMDSISRPYWVIAVTWLAEDTGRRISKYNPNLFGPTNPTERDKNWTFLGYDIADGFQQSGLTNCGYSEDEVKDWRRKWGGYLNQYHLFEDIDKAFEFRDLTDERVAEHAPFSVYGLWLIRKCE